jgi:N-acetylneuraminate synthase/N,N'-diacetyllegionaminate synthase
MLLFNKDTEKEVIVIAEIGVNHMGSLEWILKMLPQVKEAGADAIKFQLFTPDLYVSRSNPERHMQVSKLALSKSDFLQIKKIGDSIDLPVFATPLSHDWVSFIAEVCGVIKIASGDFSFAPTVDTALMTSSKIIISSGATSRDEVKNFVLKAKKMRPGSNYYENIALLHCISSYPPPNDESNLSAIADLKELTDLTIGFSSHFLFDAPLYTALGAGARIFEIHVTDDRARTDIRDHALSRTPLELSKITRQLNELNLSLISGIKSIQPSERIALDNIRKGLVYSRDLIVGHKLLGSDIDFARPLNSGFHSASEIKGKILKRNVSAFFTISLDDFE